MLTFRPTRRSRGANVRPGDAGKSQRAPCVTQRHRARVLTMCLAAYLATSLPPWPSKTPNSDVRAGSVWPEALAGGGSMSSCTAWASSYDTQLLQHRG